jgi:hypothetical protein
MQRVRRLAAKPGKIIVVDLCGNPELMENAFHVRTKILVVEVERPGVLWPSASPMLLRSG